jgi:hypothetical protein
MMALPSPRHRRVEDCDLVSLLFLNWLTLSPLGGFVMGFSISMRNQGRATVGQSTASLNHNKRLNVKGNPDLNLDVDNIILDDWDLQELYHELFDDSLQKFNDKQSRASRKIENYLKHVDKSGNLNVSNEFLVSIGDKSQNDEKVLERKIKALKEFYSSWKNDNHGHMRVFHASIHLDEANPHLHINYVPVANDYKKGMEVRPSISKAIKQLGFEDYESWRTTESARMIYVMEKHGLEYEYKNSEKRAYLEVPEFKAMKQELEKNQTLAHESKTKVKQYEKIIEQYEPRFQRVVGEVKAMEEVRAFPSMVEKEFTKGLGKNKKTYIVREKDEDDRIVQLARQQAAAVRHIGYVEKENSELQFENKQLKNGSILKSKDQQISWLQDKVKERDKKIKNLKRDLDDLSFFEKFYEIAKEHFPEITQKIERSIHRALNRHRGMSR